MSTQWSSTSEQNRLTMLSGDSSNLPRVWSFGGGKGGIGKSFITANIAVCLAQMGYSVIIVDLDLGGANIHTVLGGEIPKVTLSDFIQGRVPSLQDVVSPSPIKNLSFISGAEDALNIADLNDAGKKLLLDAVPHLKAQYVFLDLGAGTSNNTLDFFLAGERSFVVTTPEPTSIENAYRFIKSTFYRRLTFAEGHLGIANLIDEVMNNKASFGVRTPADLIRHICAQNVAIGERLQRELSTFRPQLIINQVRTESDRHMGHSMTAVCKKYFGILFECVGHLEHDNAAWQALRRKRPVVIEYPSSQLTRALFGLSKQLVGHKPLKAVI